MTLVTPLEVAQMLERFESGGGDPYNLPHDPATGLYICEATEPPTELTTAQYHAAIRVLAWRVRARAGA